MKKFLVRYARTVIMETEVEAESEDEVRDSGAVCLALDNHLGRIE